MIRYYKEKEKDQTKIFINKRNMYKINENKLKIKQ